MTVVWSECLYFRIRCHLTGIDLGFDLKIPFVLSSTAGLSGIERGLSERSEFRSAALS